MSALLGCLGVDDLRWVLNLWNENVSLSLCREGSSSTSSSRPREGEVSACANSSTKGIGDVLAEGIVRGTETGTL